MTILDEFDMAICRLWRETRDTRDFVRLHATCIPDPERTARDLREIACFAGDAAWVIEGDSGCRKEAAE